LNVLNILLNVIVLMFPLMIYLFYMTYVSNLDQKQNETFLDFALLSSLYLSITYNNIIGLNDFRILLNIPLIISFVKRRNFIGLIISFIIIFNYFESYPLNLLLIEYLIYYISYLVIDRLKLKEMLLNVFVCIKSTFTLCYIIKLGYNETLLSLIVFIIITYLVVYMFKKGEDIIKLHMSIKELEKEKQIRTSLFKITHEIKNPIAVCKSYLDMFDINNKDHFKYIVIVKDEIEKILILLQDFLSMNKIQIKKEILDINLLLGEIIDQFEPVLKEKNIEFKHEIDLDEEIFIEGDYNRLSQVLVNIIKNSIEATDFNKKSYISINYEIDDVFKIIIEDNGIGFDDDIEKIKEPFYTTKKNGTGLGVSLSCEIIESHDGSISYFTKVNEGTKVVIELPLSNLFCF